MPLAINCRTDAGTHEAARFGLIPATKILGHRSGTNKAHQRRQAPSNVGNLSAGQRAEQSD